MIQSRKYVSLSELLAAKLSDWYTDSDELEEDQLRKACNLMTSLLSARPSGEIISANSASGAVSQFRYALDDEIAWAQVEKELNEMTLKDLEDYQFPDLIHYICLCYS